MKGVKALLILSFLIYPLFSISEGQAEKPSGPLELSFSTDPAPAVGAVIQMTLTVTPRMDTPELTISVEVPSPLPHQEGGLHRAGAATGGQPVSLSFQVGPLGAQSYEIIGRATLKLPNGSTWTQAASILLEPVAPEKPQPRLRQNRQGQPILETPVQ